jgi:plasmid segregation protein ParM
MNVISIDVGYSATKAVTSGGRALIPSVVAPFRELPLADLARNGSGHSVSIRTPFGDGTNHFVGDLAVREGQGATFTLDREKHLHPNHDILVLTAARLLDTGPSAVLVVDLPVAYYRRQKDVLVSRLESLRATVAINDGPEARISFSRVVVYPQGAGALLMAPGLPASGLVLLVDVGYKTTDFITAEVAGGSVRPVGSLCGSVETGLYDVDAATAAAYQDITGMPVSPLRLRDADDQGKMFFYGREIDLSAALAKARKDVAVSITDQVTAQLGDRAAFVRRVYLAGGGAEALPLLLSTFQTPRVIPGPQWANAAGNLKAVAQSQAANTGA